MTCEQIPVNWTILNIHATLRQERKPEIKISDFKGRRWRKVDRGSSKGMEWRWGVNIHRRDGQAE